MLFLCVFLMWAFVFAWHTEYSGHRVFATPFKPGLWSAATLYAVGAALLIHWVLDPAIQRIEPRDYPDNTVQWAAMASFQLGLGPLCVCFSPFAFFMRMSRRQTVATALTVLWAVFVEYSAISRQPHLPPLAITSALMLRSVVGGFVSVYFYINGGALLVWWVGLLLQLRLLLDLFWPHA